MTKAQPEPRDPNRPRVYNSKEAAEFLRCSVPTLRNLVKAGQLKPTRAGSRYLFPESELERFVASGTDGRYREYIAAKKAGGGAARAFRQKMLDEKRKFDRLLAALQPSTIPYAPAAPGDTPEEARRKLEELSDGLADALGTPRDEFRRRVAAITLDTLGYDPFAGEGE